MKVNEMPKKIYCESDGLGNIVKAHNIKWPDDEAENIEYIRTDAFIEKACEFISLNVADYIDVTHKGGIEHLALQERFIDAFRKYMRGE